MDTDPLRGLAELYAQMEARYNEVAAQIGLTCANCPDNCCTSYFQHHTHVEWAYLWAGLHSLPPEQLTDIRARAQRYEQAAQQSLAAGQSPDLMCPLNDDGRCILYSHRLMICRLHGVPNSFVLPNGQRKDFPGCFRCQEISAKSPSSASMDRTDFYRALADLEMVFLRAMATKPPRVRLTLAQMIQQGPPVVIETDEG
jgi:hypothetical protein